MTTVHLERDIVIVPDPLIKKKAMVLGQIGAIVPTRLLLQGRLRLERFIGIATGHKRQRIIIIVGRNGLLGQLILIQTQLHERWILQHSTDTESEQTRKHTIIEDGLTGRSILKLRRTRQKQKR